MLPPVDCDGTITTITCTTCKNNVDVSKYKKNEKIEQAEKKKSQDLRHYIKWMMKKWMDEHLRQQQNV